MALAALPQGARAQDLPDRIVQAEVLTGWRGADGQHMAGLRLTLAPGWKTYWRVPGEAGIPPEFNWRGSRNVTAVQVVWPTPRVFDQAGTQSIGYAGQVVLPLALATRQAGQDARLTGRIEIGVCADICVPETLTIDATLPAAAAERPAALIAALADRPFDGAEAGLRAARCRVRPIEGGMRIEARIDMPSAGAPEAVVIEPADPSLYVSQAATRREGGTLLAEARVYHMDGKAFALARDALRLTVIGSSHAVDIRGCAGF